MNYKFSIITPEHQKNNIPYLLELYETIVNQTYFDWEWVIYVNGNCKISDIPSEITSNDKVKVFSGQTHENIGFIKNKAFNLGKGDILVEVDHDDLISPNCLEELNKAYQDPEVGFVYSNAVMYDLNPNRVPWNPNNGWTYTIQEFRGEKYYAMDSFPPTSHSMSIIWYAPDHIRTWRKSTYQKLNGHNPELNICDDHELLIRTYLNTKMVHIPEVLYYYRWIPDGSNTQTLRQQSIQEKTFELFHKYAFQVAEYDADKRNLLKVDISPFYNRRSGCLSLGDETSDVPCDLNDGIPLEDNSVFVLYANDILQKLKDPIKTMSEIYRVLSDGGWAFIEVPSTDGRGAFQDPTHVSYWNENSFWYYTRKDKAQYIRNTDIRFQEYRLDTVWWENNIAVTNAWLCAIKSDKRRPHPVMI
jgi:glycosyltransferase involved in cell wall biosynthesis